jgi:hypothetical protein
MELTQCMMQEDPAIQALWIPLNQHTNERGWTYHVVPVIDGIVHCAWYPDVMLPPEDYVAQLFGKFGGWVVAETEKVLIDLWYRYAKSRVMGTPRHHTRPKLRPKPRIHT